MASGFFGALTGLGTTANQFAEGMELARQRRIQEEQLGMEREKFGLERQQAELQSEATRNQINLSRMQQEAALKGIKLSTIPVKDKEGNYWIAGTTQQGGLQWFKMPGEPVNPRPAGLRPVTFTVPDPNDPTKTAARQGFFDPSTGMYYNSDQTPAPDAKPYVKPQAQNLLSTISSALQGDPQAQKVMKTWEDLQTRIRMSYRGMQLVNLVGPGGQMMTLPLTEAYNRISNGDQLTMVGTAPFTEASNVQLVAAESYPAIDNVEKNIGAFDNAGDRAIFARLFSDNPATTVGNLLNSELRNQLSPQGQQLAVGLGRLLETMGRVRTLMRLPQTDQAQSLSMNLVPAGQTPSADYAKQQLDQIRTMVDNALSVPLYQPFKPGTAAPAGTVRFEDLPK